MAVRTLRSLKIRRLGGPASETPRTFTASRITVGRSRACQFIVPEPSVSALHFELRVRGDLVELRDLESTNGLRFGERRVFHVELRAGDRFSAGDVEFELMEVGEVEVPVSADDRFEDMWGDSPVIREVFAQLDALADSSIALLIAGETGTGKGVAARSLHLRSNRAGPFVVLDCRGTVLESLDAAFEDADGGTLLLDDLAELSADQQPRLLHLLDRQRDRAEGRDPEHPVDVRIVAATRADLPKLVATKRFREDLYFRVAQAVIELPPLRERGDDIELLAAHFIAEQVCLGNAPVVELSREARVALRAHRWPGNVRELRNVVQRSMHLAQGRYIHPADLAIRGDADLMAMEELLTLPYQEAHAMLDRYYLRRIMAETRGNITHAAQRLGTSRRALRERLKRLNLYSTES